jgi:alpha 1,2-mannosyltransferase
MLPEQLEELRNTHTRFIGKLQSRDYALPYTEGSRGIVTTAGGSYLPVAVVSIRMLRRTGSKLPLELFLASKEEWDADICGAVLPTLDTRCLV